MASHHQVTIRPRSLANVLLDLKEARRDYDDALAGICPDCRGDGGNSSGFYFRSDHSVSEDFSECPCCEGTGKLTDADDRATEADTRVDDLRDEFTARFHEATGLTWKQIEDAISEAVL
jgi:hypothetical protein